MKTIKVFFFTALLICTSKGFAQEYDNYPLKDYITPDMVRNALDLSANSSGSFKDNKSSDTDAFSIGGGLDTKFERYKNTRKFYGIQNASLTFSGYYNDDHSYDTKMKNLAFSFSYNNLSRFYKTSNFFFETGLDFGVNYYKNKEEKAETTDNRRTNITFSLPLYIGTGRLEDVTEARQAVYVLDKLAKKGLLTRHLSNEEINALAQVMSKVKNKRFLDARLRIIEEISTIDSFFVENNMLNASNAAYYTTLYDYWMYGGLFRRESGTVISGGLKPGFNYNRNEGIVSGEDKTDRRTKNPFLDGSVSLAYENPVNLYWQQSAKVALNGRYARHAYEHERDIFDYKVDNYTIGQSGYYKWGYYPNSRTNINFGIEEQVAWNKYDRKDNDNDYKVWSVDVVPSIEMYYYFSPQLRLTVTGGLGFQYKKYDYDQSQYENDEYIGWNGRYNVSLSYAFF